MSTKWCRFEFGKKPVFGKIEGETVHEIEGEPWGQWTLTKHTHPLKDLTLLAPVVPPTFYCVGLNYPEHIKASAKRRGIEPKFPERPDVNFRSSNALVGQDHPIIKPADAGEKFQYEGELAVVIGKGGRHIAPEHALAHVFGWTIANDVSERNWQRGDRTGWRAKNSDTFNPVGPWIVTDLDYRQMTTTIRLNGEEVDRFATGDMVHDVETYIAEISRYCTLRPGDVILMGTDGEPRNMKPGDLCEIEISGIGILRNPVVAES